MNILQKDLNALKNEDIKYNDDLTEIVNDMRNSYNKFAKLH